MTQYGAFNGAVMARKIGAGDGLRHKGPTAPLYGAPYPNPEAVIARTYGAYGARSFGRRSWPAIVQRVVDDCRRARAQRQEEWA